MREVYELWAKRKGSTSFEKIEEFEYRGQVYSKVDGLLETGEYLEATVLLNHLYIYGKKYRKSKAKTKRV